MDVRDAGLRGRPDAEVFSFARAEGRVLVSGDLGFANVLEYPPGAHAGIVVARLPNTMPVDSVISVLEEAVTELGDDAAGCLVIVEEGRVRLRRP